MLHEPELHFVILDWTPSLKMELIVNVIEIFPRKHNMAPESFLMYETKDRVSKYQNPQLI